MRPTDSSKSFHKRPEHRRSSVEQLEPRVVLDSGFGMTESYVLSIENSNYGGGAYFSTTPGSTSALHGNPQGAPYPLGPTIFTPSISGAGGSSQNSGSSGSGSGTISSPATNTPTIPYGGTSSSGGSGTPLSGTSSPSTITSIPISNPPVNSPPTISQPPSPITLPIESVPPTPTPPPTPIIPSQSTVSTTPSATTSATTSDSTPSTNDQSASTNGGTVGGSTTYAPPPETISPAGTTQGNSGASSPPPAPANGEPASGGAMDPSNTLASRPFLDAIDDSAVIGLDQAATVRILANDVIPTRVYFNHYTQSKDGPITKPVVKDGTIPAGYLEASGLYFKREVSLIAQVATLGRVAESTVQLKGFSQPEFLSESVIELEHSPLIEYTVQGASQKTAKVKTVRYKNGEAEVKNLYGTTVYRNLELTLLVIIPSELGPRSVGQAYGYISDGSGGFHMDLKPFNSKINSALTSGEGNAILIKPVVSLLQAYADARFSLENGVLNYKPNGYEALPQHLTYDLVNNFGQHDRATIFISTADLDAYEYDGVVLHEGFEMQPGLFISTNDDDDNNNQLVDLAESNYADPDLAKISIKVSISSGSKISKKSLSLNYDSESIRIYSTPQKVLPNGTSSLIEPTVAVEGLETGVMKNLWVEGLRWSTNTVQLVWTDPNNSILIDSIKIIVAGIDVDIDSDNDGKIQHSEWEEELEDHDLALGKLLYFDQELQSSIDRETLMETIKIALPKNLDEKLLIEFTGNKLVGDPQDVEILNKRSESIYRGSILGHLGDFSLEDLGYSPSTGIVELRILAIGNPIPSKKLDYNVTAEIYDEHTDEHEKRENDRVLPQTIVKPDSRIETRLIWPSNEKTSPIESNKFMVLEKGSFYDHVQKNSDLRHAGAAEAVYEDYLPRIGPVDLVDYNMFGLDYISFEDMKEMFERRQIIFADSMSDDDIHTATAMIFEYLYGRPNPFGRSTAPKSSSLKAGLYRDYVSGSYILSFRGTEPVMLQTFIDDMMENIKQGYFGDSQAYSEAAHLAWALNALRPFNQHMSISGHSMGGGLASFAGSINTLPTVAFNPAGVKLESFTRSGGFPLIEGVVPDINASTVKFYYVSIAYDGLTNDGVEIYDAPDILTHLALRLKLLPNPIGYVIPLEGLYNIYGSNFAKINNQSVTMPETGFPSEFIEALLELLKSRKELFLSHGFNSIYYGMLHSDNKYSSWNSYDHSGVRSR